MGRHGAGAARFAFRHFGARDGIAEGHAGQSYAIPTRYFKGSDLITLPLDQIEIFAVGKDLIRDGSATEAATKFFKNAAHMRSSCTGAGSRRRFD